MLRMFCLVCWVVLGVTLPGSPASGSPAEKQPSTAGEYARGVRLVRAGRLEEAARLFQRLVRAAPGEARLHAALGRTRLAQGDLGAAVQHLGEAARRAPGRAGPQLEWGLALTPYDRLSEAVAALREAVRLEPRSDAAQYFLGETLGRLGQLAEARPHLDAAVALRPQEPAYLLTRGWQGLQAGAGTERVPAAEADFRRVLDMDPGRPEARYGLGVCHQRRGRWESARGELQAATSLAPELSGAWYALSQVERRLGRREAADSAQREFQTLHAREVRAQQRGFFESQAAVHPASADARFLLGEFYRRQGQETAAGREFRAALRLSPGHRQARRALAALRSGGKAR